MNQQKSHVGVTGRIWRRSRRGRGRRRRRAIAIGVLVSVMTLTAGAAINAIWNLGATDGLGKSDEIAAQAFPKAPAPTTENLARANWRANRLPVSLLASGAFEEVPETVPEDTPGAGPQSTASPLDGLPQVVSLLPPQRAEPLPEPEHGLSGSEGLTPGIAGQMPQPEMGSGVASGSQSRSSVSGRATGDHVASTGHVSELARFWGTSPALVLRPGGAGLRPTSPAGDDSARPTPDSGGTIRKAVSVADGSPAVMSAADGAPVVMSAADSSDAPLPPLTVTDGLTLTGSTVIDSTLLVSAGGTINPGNSPGVMEVNGDFILVGLLEIEIEGSDAGEFDLLDVTGDVYLSAGTVRLQFETDADVSAGDSIVFLKSAGENGIIGFGDATLEILGLDAGFEIHVDLVDSTLQLTLSEALVPISPFNFALPASTSVTAPATVLLLASCILAIAVRRRGRG